MHAHGVDESIVREVFASCGLWSDAPSEVIDDLLAASTVRRYSSSQTVLDAESSGHFLVVIQGRVRTSASGQRGHEVSFMSGLAGESLAIIQAIQEKPLGISFVASEQSVVAVVPLTALRVAIESHPDIAYQLALMFARRFITLSDFVKMLDADVHCRLAAFILSLDAETPDSERDIDLGMSRRELASRLGTVPETLSRAFGKLREDGLVETNGRRWVTILDHEGLRALTR